MRWLRVSQTPSVRRNGRGAGRDGPAVDDRLQVLKGGANRLADQRQSLSDLFRRSSEESGLTLSFSLNCLLAGLNHTIEYFELDLLEPADRGLVFGPQIRSMARNGMAPPATALTVTRFRAC